jgi:PTH1 family peptidyl-tRNA hydrolase
VKLKVGGGHAGHNGLKSIISSLGTRDFLRVRVGIGRPRRGDVSAYVLAPFSSDEAPWLDDLCRQAAQDVALLISEGPRAAMNKIHGRDPLVPPPPSSKTDTI